MAQNEETKELVAELYDRPAPHYAKHLDVVTLGKHLVEMERLEGSLRVLDATCGTGAIILYAGECCWKTGLFVGVDLTPVCLLSPPPKLAGATCPTPWPVEWSGA